jgi:hypothetical protein
LLIAYAYYGLGLAFGMACAAARSTPERRTMHAALQLAIALRTAHTWRLRRAALAVSPFAGSPGSGRRFFYQ